MEIIKLDITKEDIVPAFQEIGKEYFECGQGYYETDVDVVIEIANGERFEVNMTATIEGNKQDCGDRLYFVESIDKVTYKEVTKKSTIINSINDLENDKNRHKIAIENIDIEIRNLEKEMSELK